ncbi:uncharacterized protein K460DRAFT_396682 [Cucurbitaria berberidis CBS 394.84]|uniref:Uncharacterized protein n=1 Tax=Cucurbitaria berberidis CBS 394.84 TaxID=1168544 RepID=A0A9P4GDQ6_9PLEO|nr:uncharacterized protein K460DRAFT_396682 [Cucurbitaria berberidis CBS 394.84]KAF1843369.1 hypothetical protein K460DRAFT_396682 [Cucurbitaria berberidis CBS 394.84]
MSSTANTTMHERDIPGLAAQAIVSRAETCHTELSFCVPTSLAFAKRLTWEQTPWIRSNTNRKSANPINEADAHTIAYSLSIHQGQTVSAEAVKNALLFGTTYHPSAPSDEQIGTYPYLLVVFPHAQGNISRDTTFLNTWHDQIIKPAFDRAWKDSGLTTIYGAEVDGQSRILPPSGTRTVKDALPAKGFLERLRNGNPTSVRDCWPVWNDDWGLGTEGRYTAVRSRIYSEAWEAIKGMVKGHPDLLSFQDPILLALCGAKIYVAPELPVQSKFKYVAQEWDKFVDARYVENGSFKVVFQTVLGTQTEGAVQLEPEPFAWIGDATGRSFKRMVEDVGKEVGKVGEKEDEDGGEGGDEDLDADKHRDKQAREG